jgi:hypothetical protein
LPKEKRAPAPEPPTTRKDQSMIAPSRSIQDSPPETLIVFDCRGRGAKNRLHRDRRAWGSRATIENLGYGRAVLVIRPGGATELAR